MKIFVLNGSPSGDSSITLQTVLYIEQYFADHPAKPEFEILHVGQRIRQYEKDFSSCRESLENADLILFCYPVYTFLVPSQLHRFIELIREHGVELRGKYATQLTTSKHFYDTTAHRFIEDVCADFGMKYVKGLSADMEDLLTEKGRREAVSYFRYVLHAMKKGWHEPLKNPGVPEGVGLKTAGNAAAAGKSSDTRIVIITDLPVSSSGAAGEEMPDASAERLKAMINSFISVSPAACEVVNLREYPFAGGCLGCFRCAADGTCVYKDGFDEFLRNHIQTADAIVYAYTIRDHSMGSRFKMFDDRQFCNGHRTVTMGKPVGYLVDGHLRYEENLKTLMTARAEVGGNFLAGIATDEDDPDREISQLAGTLAYAVSRNFQMPATFYGVGGMKIFRDLIWQMQGLMREDHRFYKEHGFYDFPQKRRARMLGMYLVGSMMQNPVLRKKMGGKMTEGMLMPYKAALKKKK